jgi:uncharacterized membrane protein
MTAVDRTWSDPELPLGRAAMIYSLAVFVPPLALLLNGQIGAALLNLILILPCLVLGIFFHVLLLVPSAHAVIAIYNERENRKHREIVDAIERHGPPPGWRY